MAQAFYIIVQRYVLREFPIDCQQGLERGPVMGRVRDCGGVDARADRAHTLPHPEVLQALVCYSLTSANAQAALRLH